MDRVVGIDVDLLTALDAFIDQRDVPPNPRLSRQEAVNVIVADWLVSQGFIDLPDADPIATALDAADIP